MQAELDAARWQDNVANGGSGVADKAKEPVGSAKQRKIVLECVSREPIELEAVSEDECESALGDVMGDVGDVDVSELWTGDDMGLYGSDARDSGGMCGTINFFNIDGIDSTGRSCGGGGGQE